jgi:cholesterol transport system auxiliary component
VLFDEQVGQAFHSAGRARLIGRGEVVKADYALKLDVIDFEAVYDQGPKAAPQIQVTIRGVLTTTKDRGVVDDKLFTAKVRAGDNRVGAIVPAFNQALSQTLTEIVAWVDAAPPLAP